MYEWVRFAVTIWLNWGKGRVRMGVWSVGLQSGFRVKVTLGVRDGSYPTSDPMQLLSQFSTWRFFSHEQAKSERDWLVMSSVFVASQSSCFFLCSREQIRLVENRLNSHVRTNTSQTMHVQLFFSPLAAWRQSPLNLALSK